MKKFYIFKSLFLLLVVALCACAEKGKGCDEKYANRIFFDQGLAAHKSYVIYPANDVPKPVLGFTVRVADGAGAPVDDLDAYWDYVAANGNLICASLDDEDNYQLSQHKYFSLGEQREAVEFALASGVEDPVVCELNTAIPVIRPLKEDKFIVGQKVSHGGVTIECNAKYYYQVTIDYTSGRSMKELGSDYGKCINELPVWYVTRLCAYVTLAEVQTGVFDARSRVREITKSINPETVEFIYALADELIDLGVVDKRTMFMKANLLPDVIRAHSCNVFGVMPENSESGDLMTFRTLDWPEVSQLAMFFGEGRGGLVSPLQTITKHKFKDKEVYSFGVLGISACITSIDVTNRNMVAILDAGAGLPYSYQARRSYSLDLAEAIRTKNTTTEISDFMADPSKQYGYHHLIMLADREQVSMLENNYELLGQNVYAPGRRERRYWNSELGSQFDDYKWDPQYKVIGSVNCYMLKDQIDRFRTAPNDEHNPSRLRQMIDISTGLLRTHGGKLNSDDLLDIQSYYAGPLDSKNDRDLYNYITLQMIQYTPQTNRIRVWLKNRDGVCSADPRSEFFELNLW